MILLLASLLPLTAFQFEPLTQDFSPTGLNSRRSFDVKNTGDTQIAVKVYMVHREMDLYGVETLPDASDLFFVFPAQFIVPPQTTQTVRVQWLGPKTVSVEEPYRIMVEQIPLNFSANRENTGINVLIAYYGTVYVVPESFKFGINLVSVKKGADAEGKNVLLIELENTGNTHIILEEPVITIKNTQSGQTAAQTQKQTEISLKNAALTGLINENILPGKHRVFTVPWPQGLQDGDLHATLQLEPTR